MTEHGYTQQDHQRVQSRQENGTYIYKFPDGRDWMAAVKSKGNHV